MERFSHWSVFLPQSEVVVSISQIFNNPGFGRKKDLHKSHFVFSPLHEFNKEHSMKLLSRDIFNIRDNSNFFITNLLLYSPCITKKQKRMESNLNATWQRSSCHWNQAAFPPWSWWDLFATIRVKEFSMLEWAQPHSMESVPVLTPWEQTAHTHSQTSTPGSQIRKKCQ